MKAKRRIIRIIETVLQLAILPLCVYGTWAYYRWDAYSQTKLAPANFLDAAAQWGRDSIGYEFPVIALAVCAAVAIILTWTRACRFAFIPVMIQLGLTLRTIGYYIGLDEIGEGHMAPLGYVHTCLILAAFLVADWMFVVRRKQHESHDKNREGS